MAFRYVDVADTDTRRRNLLHVALLVLGAFLAANLLVLFGLQLLGIAGFSLEADVVLVNATIFSLNYVGFYLVAFLYLDRYDAWGLFDVSLPSLGQIATVVGGFLVLFGLSYAFELLLALLDVEPAQNVTVELGTENPELLLLLIPIAIVLNAPSEELIYRGLIQGLFREAYGAVPAVLLASALFGAVHWLALAAGGGSRLSYVVVAAALGLVLGTLYELTENISVPIAVHAIWNAYLYGSLYVAETGGF